MKNFRLYTLLALLLMAGGVTMQAQEYESYFGTDSTRLNVLQYCIDWVTTGYMEINTADTVHVISGGNVSSDVVVNIPGGP